MKTIKFFTLITALLAMSVIPVFAVSRTITANGTDSGSQDYYHAGTVNSWAYVYVAANGGTGGASASIYDAAIQRVSISVNQFSNPNYASASPSFTPIGGVCICYVSVGLYDNTGSCYAHAEASVSW